jgi:PAS domain S-box-containing protein
LLYLLATHRGRLQASEQKLATILESVDSAIYMKDTEGRYIFANRRVCELFGVPLEVILGTTDACYFDPASAAGISLNDRQVLVEGKTLRTEECNQHLRTGRHPDLPLGQTAAARRKRQYLRPVRHFDRYHRTEKRRTGVGTAPQPPGETGG